LDSPVGGRNRLREDVVMPIKYQIGDVVVVRNPGLPVSDAKYRLTAPDGTAFDIAWHATKEKMVGKEYKITEVKSNGVLSLLNDDNYFYFMPDWVHFPGPDKCNCDLFRFGGCTCGRMRREKLEKERTV
jgi:hypothetical protein